MNTPDTKGRFGEMIVASIFDPRFFGEEEHYIVNNLYFQEDDNTHQIDHVAICKTGIFCIETKNIQGLILGHQAIKNWKVNVNNSSYDLFNPIIQNKKHVDVLSRFLNNKYPIHNIVVFIKDNKPKDVLESVVNVSELREYIKEYPCEKELLSEEMKVAYDLLTKQKDENQTTLSEHVKKIKEKKGQ